MNRVILIGNLTRDPSRAQRKAEYHIADFL